MGGQGRGRGGGGAANIVEWKGVGQGRVRQMGGHGRGQGVGRVEWGRVW